MSILVKFTHGAQLITLPKQISNTPQAKKKVIYI